MPKSCANSLAFPMLSLTKRRHTLAKAMVVYGWITLGATEQKDNCKIAYMTTLTPAVTTKMPESYVKSVIRRPYPISVLKFFRSVSRSSQGSSRRRFRTNRDILSERMGHRLRRRVDFLELASRVSSNGIQRRKRNATIWRRQHRTDNLDEQRQMQRNRKRHSRMLVFRMGITHK